MQCEVKCFVETLLLYLKCLLRMNICVINPPHTKPQIVNNNTPGDQNIRLRALHVIKFTVTREFFRRLSNLYPDALLVFSMLRFG